MKARFNILLALTLLLAVVGPLAGSASAAPTGLKVAIYCSTGAESDKILALFRAVASVGDTPYCVGHLDIINGHLTTTNFNVFILPAGEDGKRCCVDHYSDNSTSLGKIAAMDGIRNFLNAGGGMVAIEAGAYYASLNGGTLDVYNGNYTNVTNQIGKKTMTITDATFGSGTLDAWQSYGGGYFALGSGATAVAKNSANQPVIVRNSYGAGRIIATSQDLELRGDSEADWTIWDNWAMGGVHANSAGNWAMLGRMIGWAYNGDSSAPTVNPSANTGSRIAVLATHTQDGGAYPGLLPAIGKSIEYAGHTPLAIRATEIINNQLTLANFKVIVFPGGYSYGYKVFLAGQESKIRSFITSGGGYYGICAGGFYAPTTIVWQGTTYTYPLGIYQGVATGDITDIVPAYPAYSLTPIAINDPVIGTYTQQQLYYGGGWFSIPSDAQQGSHVYTVGTYDYSGTQHGKADLVRYTYGAGHVVLTGTHPEIRAGSNLDWTYWDDFQYNTNTPLNNPDNPWTFVNSAFDNWLTI